MGEGETDTPRSDEFSAEREGRQFRADLNHESLVQEAGRIMADKAVELEGRPESRMDELIDELLEEQKKPKPDLFRMADIRQRLDQEHAIVMAQSVTSENAVQHILDQRETQELNEREDAIREIAKLVAAIPGLKRDMVDMADEALGDMVEDYPDKMQEIFDMVDNEVEEAYEAVGKTLNLTATEDVDAVLHDEIGLQRVDVESLRMVYAFLMKAQNVLIDEHSILLKIVDTWRKEHHQAS